MPDAAKHDTIEAILDWLAGTGKIASRPVADEFQDFTTVTRDRFGLRVEQHVKHCDDLGPGEAQRAGGSNAGS